MKMMINKQVICLTLATTTALVAGVLAISSPALAESEDSAKPEINIVVRDKSTAQISSFIQHVWRESPLVQEAQAKMNAAGAQAKADSKWLYNPEVEFEVEDKDGEEEKTKLFGISQTIDWNGKFLAAGEVAKYELQAATAERDDARQTIAVEVLAALADYQAAEGILALSDERTKLMERFAALAKKSFNAGDIDQSESNLAQLALSEALIQHADAETTLGESKLALESSVGFSANYISALPTLPDSLPKMHMNGEGVEQVIMKLPAIRMLQAQEEAYRASISRARRERLPDPTVSLKGGQEEGADLIGVSLSIPLNIFNTYGNEVDVAKYQTTAQEKSLQSAFHTAKSRLYSSKRAYELSARAWNAWQQKGSKALSQQIETLDNKFKVGELSATDYLVQVQQTLDTEIAAKELHAKAWKAWFAWIQASGNIDQWLQGE